MSLLQSLVRAYDRMVARKEVPSYGYRIRNIDYVISLDVDGTVIGEPISLITTEGKRKLRPTLEVPQPLDERTNNPDAPNFLWDTTAWVIGVGDVKDKVDSEEKRERRKKRVVQNRAAFAGKHRKWLAGTEDPGLIAFLRFLDAWDPPDGADHNAAAEFAAARFAELGWPEDMKGKFVVFTTRGISADALPQFSRHRPVMEIDVVEVLLPKGQWHQ
jgi:CRISPR-associated protein Csd1